jgi:hypothetical protein
VQRSAVAAVGDLLLGDGRGLQRLLGSDDDERV